MRQLGLEFRQPGSRPLASVLRRNRPAGDPAAFGLIGWDLGSKVGRMNPPEVAAQTQSTGERPIAATRAAAASVTCGPW
jgi:hypothetical protein